MQDIKPLWICFGKEVKMAIWQVTIHLINKKGALNFLTENFRNSLNELELFLPEEKSWCKSIKQYGKLDSTCMEFYVEDDILEDEVMLRIDLRSITELLLEKISHFSIVNEMIIKYGDEELIPTVENFVRIIRQSDAKRFLENPEKYLRTLLDIS